MPGLKHKPYLSVPPADLKNKTRPALSVLPADLKNNTRSTCACYGWSREQAPPYSLRYSYRNAMSGFTPDARAAGTYVAATATRIQTIAVTPSTMSPGG
jgi:hypothetical protein